MTVTTPLEGRPFPSRRLFDASTGRLTIVLDVLPATAADLSVRVGADRLAVVRERERGATVERTFTPPVGRGRFDPADADAVLHNGVLETTVAVIPREGDPGVE